MFKKFLSGSSSTGSSRSRGGAYGSYASKDLQDYRAHYPDNIDDPKKNKNLKFFQNAYPMQPEGVLIEEVLSTWKGKYRFLESSHSFIQWLFPIQEKGMNWESQVLQKHEIAAMRADPVILRRCVGVFRVMLDFYGMELVDEATGKVQRLPQGSYEPQYRNLNSSSHNYLRITRILKHLGEMGYEHLKVGWLTFLFEEICLTRLLPNCDSSFWNYWVGTIYDDAERDSFLKVCEEREAAEADARKKRARGEVVSQPPASVAPAAAAAAAPAAGADGREGSAESLGSSSSSTQYSSDDDTALGDIGGAVKASGDVARSGTTSAERAEMDAL